MPAKKKAVPSPTSSIPTVAMDAPLTVEQKIHAEEEPVVPTVSLNEPIPEAEVLASASDEPALERKNKLLFTIGIMTSIGIVAGSVILLVLSLRTPKQSSTTVVPIATTVIVLPTPTVAPQFVRSAIALDVLNGSGIAGAAARVAAILSTKGYSIATVGNAPIQTTTTVLVSDIQIGVKDILLADLMTSIPTATYAGVLTEGTASARLILGKK